MVSVGLRGFTFREKHLKWCGDQEQWDWVLDSRENQLIVAISGGRLELRGVLCTYLTVLFPVAGL